MFSQAEADELLAMPKEFDGAAPMAPLGPGVNERYDLRGVEHPDESFVMDFGRGRRKATKLKYQTRGRVHVVLARLDVDGARTPIPTGTSSAAPICTCSARDGMTAGPSP